MTPTFRGKGGRGDNLGIIQQKMSASVSVSYKSNKGITLTYLSKQYIVPPLAKKWGSKKFVGSLRSQKLSPNFQNRGAAHAYDVIGKR